VKCINMTIQEETIALYRLSMGNKKIFKTMKIYIRVKSRTTSCPYKNIAKLSHKFSYTPTNLSMDPFSQRPSRDAVVSMINKCFRRMMLLLSLNRSISLAFKSQTPLTSANAALAQLNNVILKDRSCRLSW